VKAGHSPNISQFDHTAVWLKKPIPANPDDQALFEKKARPSVLPEGGSCQCHVLVVEANGVAAINETFTLVAVDHCIPS